MAAWAPAIWARFAGADAASLVQRQAAMALAEVGAEAGHTLSIDALGERLLAQDDVHEAVVAAGVRWAGGAHPPSGSLPP
jgi:hypothetical protein